MKVIYGPRLCKGCRRPFQGNQTEYYCGRCIKSKMGGWLKGSWERSKAWEPRA